jgi:hypothetical protein
MGLNLCDIFFDSHWVQQLTKHLGPCYNGPKSGGLASATQFNERFKMATKKDKGKSEVDAKAEVKVDKAEVQETTTSVKDILDKISALPPAGSSYLDSKIDKNTAVAECRALIGRATVTNMTTQDNVDAVREVLDLIDEDSSWDESEDLRKAFARCTNSFPKGPILMSSIQLICGKIIEFDPADVPIFKTGAKVGSRFIYQDSAGFIRTVGRAPIEAADAMADNRLKVDPVGQKTFLSHCPRCEVDFWSPEPSHQIHCPQCSSNLKKRASGAVKVATKQDALLTLRKRLDSYTNLLPTLKDGQSHKVVSKKIEDIKTQIKSLEEAAAA